MSWYVLNAWRTCTSALSSADSEVFSACAAANFRFGFPRAGDSRAAGGMRGSTRPWLCVLRKAQQEVLGPGRSRCSTSPRVHVRQHDWPLQSDAGARAPSRACRKAIRSGRPAQGVGREAGSGSKRARLQFQCAARDGAPSRPRSPAKEPAQRELRLLGPRSRRDQVILGFAVHPRAIGSNPFSPMSPALRRRRCATTSWLR